MIVCFRNVRLSLYEEVLSFFTVLLFSLSLLIGEDLFYSGPDFSAGSTEILLSSNDTELPGTDTDAVELLLEEEEEEREEEAELHRAAGPLAFPPVELQSLQRYGCGRFRYLQTLYTPFDLEPILSCEAHPADSFSDRLIKITKRNQK